MPKDTFAANAQTIPIDRRAALGALAAAGSLIAAPRVAKAAGDDADVFSAVERLKNLRRAQKAAGERLAALTDQLPKPSALVADRDEVSRVRNAMRLFHAVGIDASDPKLGPAYARATEICRAEDEWSQTRRAAAARLGYEEADEAYADAVGETFNAARDLLDLRPRTLAGLRALVSALVEAKLFENNPGGDGDALLEMLIGSPALAGEA